MIDRVHYSRLKLMSLSPAHYAAYEREQTPAMRIGTLVHALALGGEVIVYDGERRGAAWTAFSALVAGEPFHIFDGPHRGKEWERAKEEADGRVIVTTADLEAAIPGRAIQERRARDGRYPAVIVTSAEHERAQRCADVVRAHPLAGPLLEGQREVPLEWDLFGRPCAGTIDVLGPRRVVELKSSSLAEPEWFTRQATRMHYPAQLWWYREGARAAGHEIDECYAIAVEVRPPFAVTCMRVTERSLELGAKTVRLWMERLLACEASGEWPEYSQSIVELDVMEDVELVGFEDEAA